jgi:hypothetical protein
MIIYNIIDELGRFKDYKAEIKGNGQYDTHTYSYLYARVVKKELGQVMGLEKKLIEEMKKND